MGKVMFMRKGEVHSAPANVEVGTIWLFTEDGTFTVPADGIYQIEMHGGGGGSSYMPAAVAYGVSAAAAGGGGSGEIHETVLSAGDSFDITIGAGGAGNSGTEGTASPGGTTTFGDLYSLAGGGGGKTTYGLAYSGVGGSASGSIATKGSSAYGSMYADGGYGNVNNPSQTYGNGATHATNHYGTDGQPGAVIITYLGKE